MLSPNGLSTSLKQTKARRPMNRANNRRRRTFCLLLTHRKPLNTSIHFFAYVDAFYVYSLLALISAQTIERNIIYMKLEYLCC